MINLYRKNFANLFSASKIRRQSAMDKGDSDDDSGEKSCSESESDEEINPTPSKKVKSNLQSCHNLAGLESNPVSYCNNLKDPFSVLKEKNEANLNFVANLDNREEANLEKSSNSDIVDSRAKINENEEEKNGSETSKSEIAVSGKKKQAESTKSQ